MPIRSINVITCNMYALNGEKWRIFIFTCLCSTMQANLLLLNDFFSNFSPYRLIIHCSFMNDKTVCLNTRKKRSTTIFLALIRILYTKPLHYILFNFFFAIKRKIIKCSSNITFGSLKIKLKRTLTEYCFYFENENQRKIKIKSKFREKMTKPRVLTIYTVILPSIVYT